MSELYSCLLLIVWDLIHTVLAIFYMHLSLLLSQDLPDAYAAFSPPPRDAIVLPQPDIDTFSALQQHCPWYTACLIIYNKSMSEVKPTLYNSVLQSGTEYRNMPRRIHACAKSSGCRGNAWRCAKTVGSMRKQVVPLRVYCGLFVRALRELCIKMRVQRANRAQTRLHATLRATEMSRIATKHCVHKMCARVSM